MPEVQERIVRREILCDLVRERRVSDRAVPRRMRTEGGGEAIFAARQVAAGVQEIGRATGAQLERRRGACIEGREARHRLAAQDRQRLPWQLAEVAVEDEVGVVRVRRGLLCMVLVERAAHIDTQLVEVDFVLRDRHATELECVERIVQPVLEVVVAVRRRHRGERSHGHVRQRDRRACARGACAAHNRFEAAVQTWERVLPRQRRQEALQAAEPCLLHLCQQRTQLGIEGAAVRPPRLACLERRHVFRALDADVRVVHKAAQLGHDGLDGQHRLVVVVGVAPALAMQRQQVHARLVRIAVARYDQLALIARERHDERSRVRIQGRRGRRDDLAARRHRIGTAQPARRRSRRAARRCIRARAAHGYGHGRVRQRTGVRGRVVAQRPADRRGEHDGIAHAHERRAHRRDVGGRVGHDARAGRVCVGEQRMHVAMRRALRHRGLRQAARHVREHAVHGIALQRRARLGEAQLRIDGERGRGVEARDHRGIVCVRCARTNEALVQRCQETHARLALQTLEARGRASKGAVAREGVEHERGVRMVRHVGCELRGLRRVAARRGPFGVPRLCAGEQARRRAARHVDALLREGLCIAHGSAPCIQPR